MTDAVEKDVLIARNPATGIEIGRIAATPPGAVSGMVDRASEAGRDWASRPWGERRSGLRRWHLELARRAEALADAVRIEIGKPKIEAMAAEVVPSLDAVSWAIRHAGHALRPRRVSPGNQRWLLMPSATVEHRPLGVVGVIGAWNYPVLLNVPVIAQAIASGNAVVWKPSELSSRCGALIQESIEASGLPDGLVALVQGGAEAGRALIKADVAKVVFTGGVANGRVVLETLGARGVPAVAELSGFDAATVLPDAPDGSTMAALRWSAFVGAGQTCVAVKRVYVVARSARGWAERFAASTDTLRIGDPSSATVDVGPLISEQSRVRFHEQVRAAIDAGADRLAGAEMIDGPGWFYRPTVLLAPPNTDGPERALEGCFGPVVVVREMPDPDAAVAAVNASRFGLSASVWGRDRRSARALADRLDVGMVGVNEAVTFFALASSPAGGVRVSGFGRVHGAEGLRELTATRTTVGRSSRAPRPQLFPYSSRLGTLLQVYRWLIHRSGSHAESQSLGAEKSIGD